MKNRDIKFRAFRKNKMYDPASLEELLSIASYSGYDLTYKSEVIWMQYVGIIDKNNKEIYEGDLLKINGYGDIVFEVQIDKIGTWAWSKEYQFFLFEAHEDDIEVIGNS